MYMQNNLSLSSVTSVTPEEELGIVTFVDLRFHTSTRHSTYTWTDVFRIFYMSTIHPDHSCLRSHRSHVLPILPRPALCALAPRPDRIGRWS